MLENYFEIVKSLLVIKRILAKENSLLYYFTSYNFFAHMALFWWLFEYCLLGIYLKCVLSPLIASLCVTTNFARIDWWLIGSINFCEYEMFFLVKLVLRNLNNKKKFKIPKDKSSNFIKLHYTKLRIAIEQGSDTYWVYYHSW